MDDQPMTSVSTAAAAAVAAAPPPIDDGHPFDLGLLAKAFDGRALLIRLVHIASLAPSLFPACAALALPLLRTETYDLALFDFFGGKSDDPWRAEAGRKAADEGERLEAELKSVTANLIKESIRITYIDLARLQLKSGDAAAALRSVVRTREYTTTAEHVLELSMAAIEINIELRSRLQIAPYIVKAESALNRPQPSSTSSSSAVPLSAAQARTKAAEQAKREAEKRTVGTRLGVARALASLGAEVYEQAAREFLAVEGELGEWARTVISPSELAILSALLALATLRRSALRSEVLQNDRFRRWADDEPHVRALVEAFVDGRYRTVLELLERHSTQHVLIPYLAPHLANLTASIRRLSLIQYFTPFASVSLSRMASAFALPPAEIEAEVLELVRSGEIAARVDAWAGVLERDGVGEREGVFRKALVEGERAEAETVRAIVRMRLVEEGLIITDPLRKSKAAGAGGGHADEPFIVGEDEGFGFD